MERYHIFKLGLAIIFYAVYCIRPMMVYGLETDEDATLTKNTTNADDFLVYYQGVEGRPGIDFPVYSYIPRTGFSCKDVETGYYADLDTDCQVFHICEDGKKISFLCPNGTIFQQSDLICEWWFKVNCTSAPSLYEESAEHLREDSARRKAARRVHLNANHNHGAIMRMEERASVSASQNGRHFEVKVDETATKRRDRTGSGRALQQDFQSKNNQPTQNIVYDNEAKNRYKNFNSFDYSTTTPAPRNDLNSFQSYNPVAQSSTIDLGGVRYTTNDLYAHTEKNFAQQTNYNQNEYTTQPSTASTFVESFNNPQSNYNPNEFSTQTPFVTTAPSSFSQDYSKIVNDRQSRYNTNDFTTQSYSKTPQQFSIQQSTYNTNQFSTEKPFVTTAPSSFSQEYSKTPQQFNVQQSSYNTNQFSTQTQSTTTQQQFNYNQNEFTTQTPFVSSTFSPSYSQIPNQFTNQQSNYNQNEFSTGFTSSTASTFVQSYSETPKISVTTNQPTQPTTVPPFISSTFKSLNLVKDKKYDVSAEIDFPVHESELNKSKIASKSVASQKIQNKQQSTVALTKNNLLTRRLHSPADADETQIPQETASFIKNSHNSINNDYKSANLYPNHRATYSDLKNPNLYTTKQYSMISSVTPQYITTMPINNGKPFLGNRVGSSPKSNKSTIILGVLRNTKTIPTSTTPKYVSSTPEIVTADPNSNNNPEIYVQISGGNSNVRSRSDSATSRSLFNTKPATINLKVSSNGKPTSVSKIAQPKSTTVRVPLPLSTLEPPLDVSTRKVDHATVYGSFVKSRTTPVPGNQGVQIKFDKNSSKVAVQLSKSVLGGISSTSAPDFESRQHLNDVRSTAEPSKAGFYVTKENDKKIFSSTTPSTNGFTLGTSSSSYYGSRQEKLRPRPFQLPSQLLENELDRSRARLLKGFTTESSVTATNPSYKISSASPFMINVPDDKLNSKPTVPTSLPIDSNSVYENVDNMISVLMEIANVRQNENDYSNETPRPGLIIPPSAGPQTLHTLAVYFANALDGIVSEKEMLDTQSTASIVENKEKLTALLTQMTRHHYNELFKDDKKNSRDEKQLVNKVNSSDDGLEAQHSKNFVQTPEIRQLARNFSLALSMYLDNPEMFRKDLKNFRPTEPPPLNQTGEDANDEELLNFSDADSKSSYPPIFPTSASLVPTWGYILAYNTTKPNLDVRNSLNPDLQLADSQSFIPKFNNANADRKDKDEKRKGKSDLPLNHWTTSPDATKLWQNTFSVNPLDFNKNFQTTEPFSQEITTTEDNINFEDISTINPPVREIQYELHSLPKLSLNSTQVHGILIDFMNTTKTDDTNRLQRILRKLNTTEGEFLDRMKEIENNPLTRRLILLLISECGSNVTKQLENDNREELQVQSSNSAVASSFSNIKSIQSNSNIRQLVDPNIKDDGEDARALQLLNSLYTIASKFGK